VNEIAQNRETVAVQGIHVLGSNGNY